MDAPRLSRLVGRVGEAVPERALRIVSRAVSRLLYLVNAGQRRVFERIAPGRAGPLMADSARLYAETLVNLILLCRADSFMRPPKPVELPLLPEIARLRERGKGLILAIAHFGDLFMAVSALARQGLPLTVIFVDAGKLRWIEVEKLRLVSLGAAAGAATRALGDNEVVMTYDDIPLFPEGEGREFFGARIFPPNGIARLSVACGSPVLPIYSIFEDGRHRVEADEPILPDDAPTQQDVEDRLLRSLEKYIGRYPAHWMPFHDVWDLDMMRARHRHLGNLV